VSLLDKTRKLNKILQKSGTEPVVFDDICKLLSEVLDCNVYIISRKGKVLGYNLSGGYECDEVRNDVLNGMRFPEDYNAKLLNIDETRANLPNKGICVFENGKKCGLDNKLSSKINLSYEVDPSLIAGGILRFENKLIDGSLAGQINLLKQRYQEAV